MRVSIAIYRLNRDAEASLRTGSVNVLSVVERDNVTVESVEIKLPEGVESTLYSIRRPPTYPSWVSALERREQRAGDLFAARERSAAVRVARVPSANRQSVYAIALGGGWKSLKEEYIHRGFGLRVSLGIVDSDRMRHVGHKTIDVNAIMTTQQASGEPSLRDFALDTDVELVGGIQGRVKSVVPSRFGTTVAGRDALYLNPELSPRTMCDLLFWIEGEYRSRRYVTEYSWIDQVDHVRDTTNVSELWNAVCADLVPAGRRLSKGRRKRSKAKGKQKAQVRLSMSVPEPTPLTKVLTYSFGTSGPSRRVLSELRIADYTSRNAKLGLGVSLDRLKKDYVFALNPDETVYRKWQVRRCLFGTLKTKSDTHVLHDGHFYRIEPGFERGIDRRLESSLYGGSQPCPVWPASAMDEATYNSEILAASISGAIVCDKECSTIYRGRGKLEVCVGMVVSQSTGQGSLFFVKKYEGSSQSISHLAAQASVSCQALASDPHLRNDVAIKWPRFSAARAKWNPQNWTVRICIATRGSARKIASMPFFSKLTLASRLSQIRRQGFSVALETFARL